MKTKSFLSLKKAAYLLTGILLFNNADVNAQKTASCESINFTSVPNATCHKCSTKKNSGDLTCVIQVGQNNKSVYNVPYKKSCTEWSFCETPNAPAGNYELVCAPSCTPQSGMTMKGKTSNQK